MHNLKSLETSELVELLASNTARYTNKLAERSTADLNHYEREIVLIQIELNSRKREMENFSGNELSIEIAEKE